LIGDNQKSVFLSAFLISNVVNHPFFAFLKASVY